MRRVRFVCLIVRWWTSYNSGDNGDGNVVCIQQIRQRRLCVFYCDVAEDGDD